MALQETQFRKIITDLRVAIAAVDVALFAIRDGALQVFLIPIDRPPHYPNLQGLPGGVIGTTETADAAAVRHLEERAGMASVHIEQLYTFSDPGRDKRSRSISIAYLSLVSPEQLVAANVVEGKWLPVKALPKLAYDHVEIVRVALDRLRGKIGYTTVIANLLPKEFTLSELQEAHEIILDASLDKRNFRKKVLAFGLVRKVRGKKQTSHRPAQLYTFAK